MQPNCTQNNACLFTITRILPQETVDLPRRNILSRFYIILKKWMSSFNTLKIHTGSDSALHLQTFITPDIRLIVIRWWSVYQNQMYRQIADTGQMGEIKCVLRMQFSWQKEDKYFCCQGTLLIWVTLFQKQIAAWKISINDIYDKFEMNWMFYKRLVD